MGGQRYPEEFKIDAVKQVVDRSHSVYSVLTRLDISTHSLYAWRKKYGPDSSTNKEKIDAQAKIRRLQKDLKWATDERDILKKPLRTSQSCPTEIRLLSVITPIAVLSVCNGALYFFRHLSLSVFSLNAPGVRPNRKAISATNVEKYFFPERLNPRLSTGHGYYGNRLNHTYS